MEKHFRIKKCYDFSNRGLISIITENGIVKIRDYEFHQIILCSNQSIVVKQQWVKSRKYYAEDFRDNADYVICTTIGKRFVFFILIVFALSFCYFIFTKNEWCFIPLGLLGVYVLMKIILFPSSYFLVKEVPKLRE